MPQPEQAGHVKWIHPSQSHARTDLSSQLTPVLYLACAADSEKGTCSLSSACEQLNHL